MGPSLLQATVVGDDGLVTEHDAVLEGGVSTDMTVAADNGPSDDGLLGDAAVGPDDGPLDRGLLLDVAVAAEHAVRTDARAGLYHDARVDEAGRLDRHPVFDARLRRDVRA